jgi:hypothetical protein
MIFIHADAPNFSDPHRSRRSRHPMHRNQSAGAISPGFVAAASDRGAERSSRQGQANHQ